MDYVREINVRVDGEEHTLTITQRTVGDVSAVVWDSALSCIAYLQKRFSNSNNLSGRHVCELGAGTGAVGLAAATLGATVTLTDLPEAMPLLKANAVANKFVVDDRVTVTPYRWGDTLPQIPRIDLLLAIDCVYYKESLEPLINSLDALSTADTEIVLFTELRDIGEAADVQQSFFKLLHERFRVRPIDECDLDNNYRCDEIVAHCVRKQK